MNQTWAESDSSPPTIAFASDIHFEFHRQDPQWLPDLPASPDVLILAGDIDIGDHAIRSIRRIANHLPHTQIIFIAGNHEFYKQDIDRQIRRYRETFLHDERIHFLENDHIDLCGITFLGCTLWTGFDVFDEFPLNESLVMAQRNIADFRYIEHIVNGKPSRFLASSAEKRYKESKAWLDQTLQQCNPLTTIVITHFPPHSQLLHGVIPKDILSNYFIANCDNLIDKYQPKQWIYGHNHWSDKKRIGDTLLISNQLGYPEEKEYMPEFISD